VKPPIDTQRARSTNWKAGVLGSNSTHSAIDRTKTISEVDSAMLRALRATIASSPREVMMNPTPTSGRKVTSDRSGQWLTADPRLSPRQQIPGDQRDDADQHGKGVVIDVPGLQPAGLARHLAGRRRDAVGTQPVDDRRVAGFPQPLAQRE